MNLGTEPAWPFSRSATTRTVDYGIFRDSAFWRCVRQALMATIIATLRSFSIKFGVECPECSHSHLVKEVSWWAQPISSDTARKSFLIVATHPVDRGGKWSGVVWLDSRQIGVLSHASHPSKRGCFTACVPCENFLLLTVAHLVPMVLRVGSIKIFKVVLCANKDTTAHSSVARRWEGD